MWKNTELSLQTVLRAKKHVPLARGHGNECDLSPSEQCASLGAMCLPLSPHRWDTLHHHWDTLHLQIPTPWRGLKGGRQQLDFTFGKEDELQNGTRYHLTENALLCVKVRPMGQRREGRSKKDVVCG